MLPIKVWVLSPRLASSLPDGAVGSSSLRFPEDRYLAFDGYVVGTGFSRNAQGEVAATLGCTHWLSDLAFSSAVSRTSVPSNPAQFSFGASYQMSRTGGKKAYTWGPAESFISSTTVTSDFWGDALYPLLAHLCSVDRFEAKAINLTPALNVPSKTNSEALRALRRFEGSGTRIYRYAQALKLDSQRVGTAAAAGAIAGGILSQSPDSVATATLWDKLVGEILPGHLLSLVPMVDRALIVPFVPGLRRDWVYIAGNEYNGLQQSQRNPRPLRGVAIMTAVSGVSGGLLGPTPDADTSTLGIGGYWENPDPASARGMVHFKSAPPWLRATSRTLPPANIVAPPRGVRGAAGAPGAGARPPAEDAAAKELERARTLWNEYARALYCYEILRGRSGSLSGPFRMDIAPGSTVAVAVGDDRFVTALTPAEVDIAGVTTVLHATVSRVTQHLNAERAQASTVLQLDHVRTDRENAQDATSTLRHPLWDNVWTGAPLVNRAAFDRSLDPG
jgi:hypothetical protein